MFKRSIKNQNIRRRAGAASDLANGDAHVVESFVSAEQDTTQATNGSGIVHDADELPTLFFRSKARASKTRAGAPQGSSSRTTSKAQARLAAGRPDPSSSARGEDLYSPAYLAELKAASRRAPVHRTLDPGDSGDDATEGIILTGDDLEPLGHESSFARQRPDDAVQSSIQSLDFISLNDAGPADFEAQDNFDRKDGTTHKPSVETRFSSVLDPIGSTNGSASKLPTIGRPVTYVEDIEDDTDLDNGDIDSKEWETGQIKRSGGILGHRPKSHHQGQDAPLPRPLPRPIFSASAAQTKIKEALHAKRDQLVQHRARASAIDMDLPTYESDMTEQEAEGLEFQKAKFEFFSSLEEWLKTCASLFARKLPAVIALEDRSLELAANMHNAKQSAIGLLELEADEIAHDVDPEYHIRGGTDTSCRLFEQWRKCYPQLYEQSYAEASLCTLLEFWIRWEMCAWQPLSGESKSALQCFHWYKAVSSYSTKFTPSHTEEGASGKIIDECISRILLPKLTRFAVAYHQDDVNTRISFVTLIEHLSTILSTTSGRKALAECSHAFGENLLAETLLNKENLV